MADEQQTQAPSQINLPKMQFDKPQFDTFLQILEESQEGMPDEKKRPAADLFAEQLSNEAQAEYPDLVTYEGLKNGTAPIFDVIGDTRQPNLRQMTPDEIIELFAVDTEGRPIQRGTFLEGFKREGVRQAGGMGGATAGYKAGVALTSGVPPVTPPTVALKFLPPLALGVGGFFLGYAAGDVAEEALFGEEQPILPSHRESYEAGKTAAGVAAFLPVPFMLGSKLMPANLGAATYLNNVAGRRAAAAEVATLERAAGPKIIGPPTKAEAAARGQLPAAQERLAAFNSMPASAQAQAAKATDPMLQRLAAGFENAMGRTGEASRAAVIPTLAFESFIGSGQTAGAFLAEEMAPGDWRYRLLGELGGGVTAVIGTAPLGTIVSRIGSIKDALMGAVGKTREEGLSALPGMAESRRQQAAVNKILDILQRNGENVDAIIEELASSKIFLDPVSGKPITPTAGLKSGSPTLLGIENALDQLGKGLGAERNAAAQQILKAQRAVLYGLISTGDQRALQEAGEIMNSIFQTNLELRLTETTDNVLKAFQRVAGDGPVNNMRLSETLYDVINNNMNLARDREKKLWGAVKDEILETDGAPKFVDVWESSLPSTPEAAETFNAKLGSLGRFVERKTKELDLNPDPQNPTDPSNLAPLTLTELVEMRSRALSLGREARARGESDVAHVAFKMADAMLEDLNSAVGEDAAYTVARNYSRALNDTFTRAFAGDALQTTKTGAERIAPELLADRLFRGGADPTYLRLQEINDIGAFMTQQGLAGAEETVNTLQGVTEKLLRNAASEIFDPETGRVNPNRLAQWQRKNSAVLERFPALAADLADADKAEDTVRIMLNENRAANDDLKGQITFASLLPETNESPTQVIGRIFSRGNRTPMRDLNNLKRVVDQAPENLRESARRGLQFSILDWALTGGGSSSTTFSPSAAYRLLFEKTPNAFSRDMSPMTWMAKNEIIDEKEVNNLKKMLTEMIKYEAGEAQGQVGELVEAAGPMLDFYLRVTGSNLGARYSQLMGGGGGDLIARQAGSRILRDVFEKMPQGMKTDVMIGMMRDPQLLAAFLRKGRTEREKMNIAGAAANLLIDNFGFQPARRMVPAIGRETAPEEEGQIPGVNAPMPEAPAPQPAPQPNLPPANQQGALVPPAQTPTQGGGAAPSPVQAASAAPRPTPSTPSGPVDRARFAALFPEDRDLMGIASLAGQG
jgi:hypothetical protein